MEALVAVAPLGPELKLHNQSHVTSRTNSGGGVKSAFLNVRISTTYCDIFLFKLPIMECVSLGVCSKVYMANYKRKINRLPELLGGVRK